MPGYNTDYIRDNALGFIDKAMARDEPFFIGVAPIGPHSVTNVLDPERGIINFTPPVPAKRHEGMLADVVMPRTYNFNPDQSSSSDWIADVPKQNQSQIDYGDEWHRLRLQSLQSVDEMVEAVILKLDNLGILDNTYVIYTSDNGFHIGQHRLQPGKACHFEEDINVPFVIRGPGVPKGKTVSHVTTHTDIAPTILELAALPLHEEFDGVPMPIKQTREQCRRQRLEHVNVEFWDVGQCGEGKYCTDSNGVQMEFGNGTFKSARIIGRGYSFSYTVWCSGGHELYDMNVRSMLSPCPFLLTHISQRDPGQMKNLMEEQTLPLAGRTIKEVADRIDALLLVLKSCKQDACREPWKQHHPNGSVKTLKDALSPKYDAYYASQPKVAYKECQTGYLLGFEGPQWGGWGGD
jgi:arylsulfatase